MSNNPKTSQFLAKQTEFDLSTYKSVPSGEKMQPKRPLERLKKGSKVDKFEAFTNYKNIILEVILKIYDIQVISPQSNQLG